MSDGTVKITEGSEPGSVVLRNDRPGISAVSVTRDARELIEEIASVAGLNVQIIETPNLPE